MMQEQTLHKLRQIKARFEELQTEMGNPDVFADQERYLSIVKEAADLTELVETYSLYENCLESLLENRELLESTPSSESEMTSLIRDEIQEAQEEEARLEAKLIELLQPKDPRDERNVIIEIRGGAGGDEAALFAAELFQMYSSYADRRGFGLEMVDLSETEIGGYKEVVFILSGKGAYSRLKYESGVHRVQRVPVTESGGRIHTSTVTVAVMPEVDEVDIVINPKDLQIDTYRASGAGGQHVNKTSSAIRITHLPSGLVVTCQDQRSQYKNKDKAMSVLRARLLEMEEEKRSSSIAGERKSQVGTGDRSERIRTYNYPQGRVTDHRIGLTLYKLEEVLNGDIDAFVEALTAAARTQQLAKGGSGEDDE